ncbi:GrpB family protein [Tetragenococcus halophilus]|uniref:GrpB family protein n=1 Tax=Tetragenococcus halophilus TaxID=51669 RepID=A0A3G5FFR4_TETHA|nr:GrpB family protein [Tetragenococcus halophilus]AYW49149.1 GrpB family protein [Tetragenococcus halophilus]MCF1675278.1 GrpB family protein [Tetragenococcus halophilus]MCO8285190.1 GrpB family protein [Tetragenococcus halophilus]MCO8288184.1 GrpB family protein [Tetragenococcus halophilus]MCO8290965.1 GrpB family protein [Tetragenococcus halophilus]
MHNKRNCYSSSTDNDEYLKKVTVGRRKSHNAPIELVDYNPNWVDLFGKEAKRIKSILDNKVLQLEHVGSTSVPDLCAKPIIDILLVVADSSCESSYVPALESAGYILRIREPAWYEHRLFKGPDTDINLHVFSEGALEINKMLRFRNWLRTNREDREKYAKVKRELAQNTWENVQDYADAKTEIIERIMKRANSNIL